MLIGIEKLRELFESSGNGLRFNWADDYLKLQEYLATNKIKIEQINLTATHNGVFAKLLDFLANHRAWDEISVAQVLPELGSIVNYDGQRHGALCLSAAAWLIDHGYEVLTEVWLNGRRVDLMTKCHTWLIECGETSPQPLVSHLNRGINKIAIIPFQGQELSSRALSILPVKFSALAVTGYGKTEAKRIDIKRNVTRVGEKKVTAVRLSVEQANQLKQQPDTPQGRRDALLMCLLLDHGLRVGEVALLQAEQFDRASGQFRFERPKVDGTQTHKLTADTLRAFYAWVSAGDCPSTGPLLRESLKNGELTEPGMSERAIKARVRLLGERIGVSGLSPHDCRHFWATYWADKVNILRLQEAGGWASLEMPRRYVERAKIANEGMA